MLKAFGVGTIIQKLQLLKKLLKKKICLFFNTGIIIYIPHFLEFILLLVSTNDLKNNLITIPGRN